MHQRLEGSRETRDGAREEGLGEGVQSVSLWKVGKVGTEEGGGVRLDCLGSRNESQGERERSFFDCYPRLSRSSGDARQEGQ